MNEVTFDNDIFLKTDFPVALDSPDHYEEISDGATLFEGWDGVEFAQYLMKLFPGHKTLIDLGTACGKVPLSMRNVGMLSVGLEGSDKGKNLEIGCWSIRPELIRSCDISRPFYIADKDGNDFKFDFVISYATFEHIHPDRMDILWENIKRLMHKDSIGMFNIDIGCNIYHLSGGVAQVEWQRRIENNFELLKDLTFAEDGQFRDHPYYRPTPSDRVYAKTHNLPFYSGRTFWWVKPKGNPK